MSVQTPAKSPSPKHRNREQMEQIEELQTEVAILKEKVVKLMNENARLRMTFSTNATIRPMGTSASLPIPPPPPIARSPGRNIRI